MERVRWAYGTVAAQYVELFGSTTDVDPDDLALITRNLSTCPGAVLDVGCGPGHLTAHLRSLGLDVTGIDLVPEFIDHARVAHPECRFQLGSMDQLPVPDHFVTGILAWYSLIHLPPDHLDRVLTELRRVLTPGGRVVIGFFDGDELAAFEHKVLTAYRWPADELAVRLRAVGFTELERHRRPGRRETGVRPQAAIAVVGG